MRKIYFLASCEYDLEFVSFGGVIGCKEDLLLFGRLTMAAALGVTDERVPQILVYARSHVTPQQASQRNGSKL